VIVSRAMADLAQYLEPRQATSGRGRVILDRRVEERRRAERTVDADRRQSDRRRQPPANSIEALMRVLGFTVVPTAATPRPPSSARSSKPGHPAPRAPGKSRQAGRNHRARS
jgi:hypothetical protein